MKRSSLLLSGSVLLLVAGLSAGCDPGSNGTGSGANNAGGNGSGNGGSEQQGGAPTSDGGSTGDFMGVGGGPPEGCASGPNDDADADGFTVAQGDCNDCDPNTNPGAIEVIGTPPDDGSPYVPVDEDCDGTADNPPMPCDQGLALDSGDAMDAARAIELCKQAATDQDWGVISAQYVRADGSTRASSTQNGILSSFGSGVDPRAGARLLGLSSGRARLPGQNGACNGVSCTGTGAGTAPAGFPQNAPGCIIDNTIYDDAGLEVTLRAPKNATGYKFDFKFYSFEYAEWVCTNFNDQFMALVNPPPQGAQDGNISFATDTNGQPVPVSVNIAYFTVCEGCQNWAQYCSQGCPAPPASCCPDGTAQLAGTGFDTWTGSFDDGNAGGTAWLQTTAPITGGDTFSVRFAIWDTGDTNLDATSVIDNFQWIANGGAVDVGTTPAPPQ